MNTPGIEFGRKTSAAYAALCKPLCQKLHLTQTAFDILMFLANNPGYQTASDVVEMRKLKANLVSVNVDRHLCGDHHHLVPAELRPAAQPHR